MKTKKIYILTAAAISAVLANGSSVHAAPERMADGTIFDAAYYAEA